MASVDALLAHLSPAELSALRLDGDIYALGCAHAHVDAIETPAQRARAALPLPPGRAIAALGTAAWIWGALDRPPAVPEACRPIAARISRDPARGMQLSELVLEPDDVVALGPALVTSPLRTVADLARLRPELATAERRAIHGLAADHGIQLSQVAELLDRRGHLLHKRRALSRCAEVLGELAAEGQPALTR